MSELNDVLNLQKKLSFTSDTYCDVMSLRNPEAEMRKKNTILQTFINVTPYYNIPP